MIPKKYLYGDNDFEINDLIRDAHPYGGTEVIGTESGEGVVEDSIENQMKTLQMVFREPTLQTLANLGTTLDNAGLYSLASEVDSILLKFAEEDLKEIRSKFLDMLDPLEEMLGELSPGPLAFVRNRQLAKVLDYYEELRKELNSTSPDFDVVAELAKTLSSEEMLYGSATEILEIDLEELFGDEPRGRAKFQRYRKLTDSLDTLANVYREKYGNSYVAPERAKTREEEEAWEFSEKDLEEPKADISKLDRVGQLMYAIQTEINKMLGAGTVPENGNKGDATTWQVIKNKLKLEAPRDFSNYSELLAILKNISQVYLKEHGHGERAKAREKQKGPSRYEDKAAEVTHITFEYPKGTVVENFPLTRAIKRVDIRNKNKMRDAANVFVSWLSAYGLITDKSVPNIIQKLPEISNAMSKAKIPGTDKTLDQRYPRIKSYFAAILEYFTSYQRLMDEAATRKSGEDIFTFLEGKFPAPVHPYFKVIKHPAAKDSLLKFLMAEGFADSNATMISSKPVISGSLGRIADRVKELVNTYGIK